MCEVGWLETLKSTFPVMEEWLVNAASRMPVSLRLPADEMLQGARRVVGEHQSERPTYLHFFMPLLCALLFAGYLVGN